MYNPTWKDGIFIGGTEPGTEITDSEATVKRMHYNMIFENAEPLMKLLESFPEYAFTGGPEGHFEYPTFTRARFCELIDAVVSLGGFFVHPHPKQLMKSEDPLQYYFRDGMGIEVIYGALDDARTEDNYQLWCGILALGKKVYATAGCDNHACCCDTALTTIYAEERKNASYIKHLREGDFVAGSVGIKMAIGNTRMGGECNFENQTLTACISDFHKSVFNPEHKYRIDVICDTGLEEYFNIDCNEPQYISLKTRADAKFYRIEVTDVNKNLRIAIGNPIWNKV
jgi:hypothetical protein